MSETPSLPDFSGKVVVIYLPNLGARDLFGTTFDSPRFEQLQGRTFLVGRTLTGHYTSEASWCEGTTTYIAWETVASFLVFDSRDAYQESVARFQTRLAPKPRGWLGR